MLFKVQKNTENVDPKALKTENGRTMLSSKCAKCSSKKLIIYERTRSKRNIK